MRQISAKLSRLCQKFFILGLTLLIVSSSTFIFSQQPSYAVTSSRDKLSAEEKVDRAYQFRQGAGVLEEVRQEKSPNKDEPFDPIDKANVESVKVSKESNPEPDVGEQVKKAVGKIIGK